MTLRDAIKLAEANGYEFEESMFRLREMALLDKEFWEALGRGLGWPYKDVEMVTWKTQWHRFIDHLAAGKDPAEFFARLTEQ
jgi:hypothetical protein